jgi:hypothetical protein
MIQGRVVKERVCSRSGRDEEKEDEMEEAKVE